MNVSVLFTQAAGRFNKAWNIACLQRRAYAWKHDRPFLYSLRYSCSSTKRAIFCTALSAYNGAKKQIWHSLYKNVAITKEYFDKSTVSMGMQLYSG